MISQRTQRRARSGQGARCQARYLQRGAGFENSAAAAQTRRGRAGPFLREDRELSDRVRPRPSTNAAAAARSRTRPSIAPLLASG